MRKILGIVMILALVFINCAKAENSTQSARTFIDAPNFLLRDLDGNDLSLSDYKDKVLFLNFWATWCPPCRAEIPDFVAAYNEHKDKGLAIIGISFDDLSPERLRSFIKKNDIGYPIAFGTRKIVDDYEPGEYIPTTIIIDKKGKIRNKHVGPLDKQSLVKIFNQLIQEE